MPEHETTIRLGFFFGIFAVMACWELIAPCRRLTASKAQRWTRNLLIVAINTLTVRLLFPAAAVGLALVAAQQGWGLLNIIALPQGLEVFLAVVALDFAIYLQHVLFHAIPALWRLHMVHHSDVDIDVTTGARFHPVEIVLSILIKFAVILALGPSATAVIIFEILLNGAAMFNHSNIRIPPRIDRIMRLFIVTPDMHRVHHSVIKDETNSNFGFNLPWWDRLLGTYRDQPSLGHQHMEIGLRSFRNPDWLTLPRLLALPFTHDARDYPLNRESE